MMKEYVEKQFIDGEKYIEAIPSGFPDWWRDFKEIVNNSLSLQNLLMELMDFEPFRNIPNIVNGQIVFNPLVYDFLIKNKEWINVFRKGHLKGAKYFKKNYFKKYPNDREMNIINNLYHKDFKQTILRGDGFFNQSNLEMLGYCNGILTAYWTYEKDYLRDFIANNSDESTPEAKELEKINVEDLFKMQNNLIPSMPIEDVYNHFKELVEKTNRHNEFYLTPEQLSVFIVSTFIKMKPIQQKFNCSFIKKDVRNIFFRFYQKGMNKERNYTNLKQKYFDIMNKGFEGFNKVDYDDFHK